MRLVKIAEAYYNPQMIAVVSRVEEYLDDSYGYYVQIAGIHYKETITIGDFANEAKAMESRMLLIDDINAAWSRNE